MGSVISEARELCVNGDIGSMYGMNVGVGTENVFCTKEGSLHLIVSNPRCGITYVLFFLSAGESILEPVLGTVVCVKAI